MDPSQLKKNLQHLAHSQYFFCLLFPVLFTYLVSVTHSVQTEVRLECYRSDLVTLMSGCLLRYSADMSDGFLKAAAAQFRLTWMFESQEVSLAGSHRVSI